MGKIILILGGGVGGLVNANELRAKLPTEHRIVLIDRRNAFLFSPSLLWLMTGDRTASKISRPLARIERKGIERIQGEIEAVDPKRREVIVQGQTLVADYIVIALGADLASDAIPGLSEAGHNFYSLSGAESFRDAFEKFSGGGRRLKHRPRDPRKGQTGAIRRRGECFIETGNGKAGFGRGNFYAEPVPRVKIHPPARRWHAVKILFEKDWLRRWF